MKLVIVESPTKSKTLKGFLEKEYEVLATMGHIRDLPKSKLGIDVEKNFEPIYVIPTKARKRVNQLKKEVGKAEVVILATDEDREGEAIAWHLVQALGLNEIKNQKSKIKNYQRIAFHEITKKAINEAIKNPRDINIKLVNAQQARRILDRLVGYKLSPFLWEKVCRGLSAGRVQSVAVKFIVDREREVQNFKPQEYWSIEALLSPSNNKEIFTAILIKVNGETVNKFAIKDSKEADKIFAKLENSNWIVQNIESREMVKNPLPPFTTSTLEQEAFKRLRFSAKQTMVLAQQLYEGIEIENSSVGLITYMRTDSVNLSEESLIEAKTFINKEYGKNYELVSPRRFKTKTKGAQEAHEAIRPADSWKTPEIIKNFLDKRQFKLYDLIWRRFISTQMQEAVFINSAIDIEASKHLFRATGQILKFDGFLKVYPMKFSENTLPSVQTGEILKLRELKPLQHFTEPPPRYSEATLIKTLEKYGIGRPSTYAPIISTIQERGYIEKYERKLRPTEIGFLVNDLLVEHFPKIVDAQFTAQMEEELDDIAEGKKEWQPVINDFYKPFAQNLEEKYKEVEKHEINKSTGEVCDKCGKPMVVKMSRFGKFLACSGFPECKRTKNLNNNAESLNIDCPKCKEGKIVMRRTKKRRTFYGCSRWPDCDFASWTKPQKLSENSNTYIHDAR